MFLKKKKAEMELKLEKEKQRMKAEVDLINQQISGIKKKRNT